MKSEADKFTSEMFSPARGRPPKEHPRSGAQRTREWRNRKKIESEKRAPITVTRDEKFCCFCGCEQTECCGICNVGQLGHVT